MHAHLQPGLLVTDRIGNTPLVRLEKVVRDLPGITLLAKAEWANPAGSVKDRAAWSIVSDALERGQLAIDPGCHLGRHFLQDVHTDFCTVYRMMRLWPVAPAI